MFLLDYFTQRELRQRVQKGLNRVESNHALARSIFMGQMGEFRLAELEAQINRGSFLQLLVAMVITWNAVYISAAVEKLRQEGTTTASEQLAQIFANYVGAHQSAGTL